MASTSTYLLMLFKWCFSASKSNPHLLSAWAKPSSSRLIPAASKILLSSAALSYFSASAFRASASSMAFWAGDSLTAFSTSLRTSILVAFATSSLNLWAWLETCSAAYLAAFKRPPRDHYSRLLSGTWANFLSLFPRCFLNGFSSLLFKCYLKGLSVFLTSCSLEESADVKRRTKIVALRSLILVKYFW